MALKFIILSTILSVATAGYLVPVPNHYAVNSAVDAVAATQKNVLRSQYSKFGHTPYSSAHKEDTRVHNNVYIPTVDKTVTYTAPALAKTNSYAPVEHHEPAHNVYAPSLPQSAPTFAVYTQHHKVPSAATNTFNYGSAATTYRHNSPSASAYGAGQTVHYSPAEMVSHMSFDGFGTHWGF